MNVSAWLLTPYSCSKKNDWTLGLEEPQVPYSVNLSRSLAQDFCQQNGHVDDLSTSHKIYYDKQWNNTRDNDVMSFGNCLRPWREKRI